MYKGRDDLHTEHPQLLSLCFFDGLVGEKVCTKVEREGEVGRQRKRETFFFFIENLIC